MTDEATMVASSHLLPTYNSGLVCTHGELLKQVEWNKLLTIEWHDHDESHVHGQLLSQSRHIYKFIPVNNLVGRQVLRIRGERDALRNSLNGHVTMTRNYIWGL